MSAIGWQSTYCPNMKKKNLIRFAQSLVFLPVISMPISFLGTPNTGVSENVLVSKMNIEAEGGPAVNRAAALEAEVKQAKAEAIDAYFTVRKMPLAGTGLEMVEEAEKNGLDWRLLAAIAVRESTGGIHACKRVKNNAFGWASCKIGFDSHEQAIEIVAKNLGGNNPNTARHYNDKETKEILRAYNPPSIVPRYAEQVMAIMDVIGESEMTVAPLLTYNSNT